MDIEVISDPAPFTIIAHTADACYGVEDGLEIIHVTTEDLIPTLANLDSDDEDWAITVLCREPRPAALIQIQDDLAREAERREKEAARARVAYWERTRREQEERERATLARLKEKYEGV